MECAGGDTAASACGGRFLVSAVGGHHSRRARHRLLPKVNHYGPLTDLSVALPHAALYYRFGWRDTDG